MMLNCSGKYFALLVFAMMAVFAACAASAEATPFLYSTTYFTQNKTIENGFLALNGMGISSSCTENISSKFNYVGSSISATHSFYVPSTNFIAINNFAGSNPICQSAGSVSGVNDSKIIAQPIGASAGNITLTTSTQCSTSNRYFEVLSGKNYLSAAGEPINRYADIDVDINTAINNMQTASNCNGLLRTYPIINYDWGYNNHQEITEIYPFNSSAGNVKYFIQNNISAPIFSCYKNQIFVNMNGFAKLWLVKADNKQPVFAYNYTWNCQGSTQSLIQNWTGEVDLTPNSLYYFIFNAYTTDNCITDCGTLNTKIREPVFVNISIDVAVPNYECGDWSSCADDGYKERTCTDLNGISPPKIEIAVCGAGAISRLDLGFEESYNVKTFQCLPAWTVIDCPYTPRYYDTLIPNGWTSSSPLSTVYGVGVGLSRNYINVVSDTATTGTQSVRLNYVPTPKIAEPVGYPATCGNLTEGAWPEMYSSINESLPNMEQNVTFSSAYAKLVFDVRKCSENVLQYDYTENLVFNIACGLNFAAFGKPVKMCYAPSCNSTVGGKYGIRIVDGVTGEIKLSFVDTATEEWTMGKSLDLSNAGFISGRNYTIGVSVNPFSQYDSNGYCLYFDNMHLDFSDAPLMTCESACDGLNYIKATLIGNGSACSSEVIVNYPACVYAITGDINKETAATNHEDFCINTTRHVWNNNTKLWFTIENSETCIAESAENARETTLYDPPLMLQPLLGSDPANPLWSLFSTFMLVTIAIATITVLVMAAIKEWRIAAVVCILFTLSFVMMGWYPLEIGVAIMVITGLLLANSLTGFMGKG